MSALSLHAPVDVAHELAYWRGEHRRGELGYYPFDDVPAATIRAVCAAYNAHPQLSEREAVGAVRAALNLPPGSINAVLAEWLAPRCLRRLRAD
ncbi:hypothetical protein [Xanthomonas maliensis]|uniref:hypothetical protein n=1 Tax=Xanthomonas maliensis TaxID=1321368 RepID=UPI0003A6D5C0|nr:hypothetical protein [Xanthomonas maliensis]KAB7771533.1 hypothetical protein CKY51_02750 [Xanthomonas maliensis]